MLTAMGNDGNLQLLVITEGGVYLLWQSSQDGSWNNFGPLNTAGDRFSKLAGCYMGSTLFVVGLASDNSLRLITQTDGAWSYQGQFAPGRYSDVAVAAGNNGAPVVVAIELAGQQPVLMSYEGNTVWGRFSFPQLSSPNGLSRVFAANGNGGNMQVIGLAQPVSGACSMVAAWQDSDGNWSATGGFPGGLTTPSGQAAFAWGNDNNLQFVYLTPLGDPALIWQSNAHGDWNSAGVLPQGSPRVPFHTISAGSAYYPPFFNHAAAVGVGPGFKGGPASGYVTQQDTGGGWYWVGALIPPVGFTRPFVQAVAGAAFNQPMQVLLRDDVGILRFQQSGNGYTADPDYLVQNL
jgi:hypothetical protein